ncbi:S-layer homology domain-containing protein [Paenibacillus sp. ACRRY]|uniref:S-layer homology domain-containing protein n=1 Tax=Paenibacillus sp. ACRRY TaxID=2918208 RepID=UPI001EF73135|nr:S-layer homology domain-containing protein [Paenibacillus sp. ACRRY]MCG7386707.1 S-layer homology domain-containing protein [Paenibacillus sp. ACRRY]
MSKIRALSVSLLALIMVITSIISPAPIAMAASDVIYVSSNGSDEENVTGSEGDPFATIEKALENVSNTGTIILQSNITLDTTLAISSLGRNITITSESGNKFSIIRGEGLVNGHLIQVSAGSKATNSIAFDNLIIEGNNVDTNAQVYGVSATGGTVIFINTEIRNHTAKASSSQPGSVITTSGGNSAVMIQEGTLIHHNKVLGFIAENPSSILGAGSGGTLEIQGGLITDNEILEGNGVIVGVGLYQSPNFKMTGGKITGNILSGTELNGGETVGNVAVFMRGSASQARFDFGGTAYVYDNLNTAGEQRNVYLKNTTATNSAYLTLISPMLQGAKVGVYAKIMPDADINPVVDIAIGGGSYQAQQADQAYFVSDINTTAAIAYDETVNKVVLTYRKPVDLDITKPAEGDVVGTNPKLSGTVSAGATVSVTLINQLDPSKSIEGEATILDDGSWEFTPSSPLVPGAYTLKVTATNNGVSAGPLTRDIVVVDKEALQNKHDDITGENLEESQYTPESWKTLEDALIEADRVLNDSGATQEQVDKALQDLLNARTGLTPTIPGVDKSLLQHKHDDITGENLEESQYTPESWKTLEDALIEADRVLNDPEATQEQVDKALEDLSDARRELTNVVDTDSSMLQMLIPSTGSLSPAFDPAKKSYAISVSNSVYQIQLTPTAIDPNAKIEISVGDGDWQVVSSGIASENLPLHVGENKIVVKVTDSFGHVTEYNIIANRAPANNNNSGGNSGNGGSSGGSIPVPTPTPVPVTPKDNLVTTLDGNNQPFATSKSSGDNQTLVQVDTSKLNDALNQGKGQQFVIYSPNEGNLKVDGLTVETLKRLTDQGAELNISNPLAIYPVPGGKMDIAGVSKQLGNAAPTDIVVLVDIKRSSEATIENAKNKAAAEGYELLVNPVDLDLTFTKDGQTIRSGQLSGYAPKYIALPDGVDPNRITTGVIINPDGSIFHVPTVVTKIDSRYYALINDLRSSGTYSVIWNPQDFSDVRSHWGQTDINNIAARLDLKGNGDNTFSPNRSVTRSEFAEIVVLGLGLMRQDAAQNIFPDVTDSAWFRSSVSLANEFGIVRGYDDGNFYGNQEITREQGFAMVARAYRLIEPDTAMNGDQITSELARYMDAADVSVWAQEDVAQLIQAGIIQGNGPEVLSPNAKMTRAEVSALVARMLKITNLIDK